MTEIEKLRRATEDDVEQALKDAYVSLPLTDSAQALEFFNLMIDTMLGQEAGDDIIWTDLERPTH